ncbi:hypothetical protein [Occultella gossypii]|uniref:Uncharacterized protein n=1 Tax=Occultella gossypii TaxID=2800820 RepID=A0ABS7SA80_9MICO|nr:hypothetical protein [Occultella gossypii]MBZ2197249.1 hypothetical protein [Occultella gossypii]
MRTHLIHHRIPMRVRDRVYVAVLCLFLLAALSVGVWAFGRVFMGGGF